MTEFRCPDCDTPLQREVVQHGVMWRCANCGGRAAGIGILRRALDASFVNTVWIAATESGVESARSCVVCGRRMLQTGGLPSSLDLCRGCRFVWFDPAEFDSAPRPRAPGEPLVEIPQDRLELLARLRSEQIAQEWRGKPDAELTDRLMAIPAVLGWPVEEEAPIVERNPWLTWSLALLLAVVFALPLVTEGDLSRDFGLIPAEAGRYAGLTLLTHFFLHTGVFHLASNVYFLFVFGDNVEDFLGRTHYALLIGIAAFAGACLHALFAPARDVALVGANAGISGVVVFYGLRFPQARLRYLPLLRWLSLPAAAGTGVWAITQVFGADRLAPTSSVSWLAHLGGVAAGAWFWYLWRDD